jgi:type IV pilus assembly protein PilB
MNDRASLATGRGASRRPSPTNGLARGIRTRVPAVRLPCVRRPSKGCIAPLIWRPSEPHHCSHQTRDTPSTKTIMAAATLPTQAVEPTVLAGLARALVQHQILRPDQAMALQKKADAAAVEVHRRAGRVRPVSAASWRASRPRPSAIRCSTSPRSTLAIPADLIDRKLAAETRVIALGKRGTRMTVAISDPTDLQTIDRIKFQTQCDGRSDRHRARQAAEDRSSAREDGQPAALGPGRRHASRSDLGGVEPTATAIDSSADVDDAPVVRSCRRC